MRKDLQTGEGSKNIDKTNTSKSSGSGSSVTPRSRLPNWTFPEDCALCVAWCRTSDNESLKLDYSKEAFWGEVVNQYCQVYKDKNEEPPVNRSATQLIGRWGYIKAAVMKFTEYLEEAASCNQNGASPQWELLKAHEFYERDHPQQSKFKYDHCFKELQGESQWASQIIARKKASLSANSASGPSAVAIRVPTVVAASSPPADIVTVPAVSASDYSTTVSNSSPSPVSVSSPSADIETVHQDEAPATTKGKKRAAEEESIPTVLTERLDEFQDNILKYQRRSLKSKKLDRLLQCQIQDHKVIMETTCSTDPSILTYFMRRKQEAFARINNGFYDVLCKQADDTEEES